MLQQVRQITLASLALFLLNTATAQTPQPHIIYSRSTQPEGAIWLNDGLGTDSLVLDSGNLAKATPDGRYILYMQHTAWDDAAYGGTLARYETGNGSITPLYSNADYIVSYDMLLADSSIVYDWACRIDRMAFDGTFLNTVGSSSCSGDCPSLSQEDSMVVFEDHTSSLYTLSLDGSVIAAVPNTSYFDRRPTWSPDGQWILFGRTGAINSQEYNPRVVNFFKIKADGDSLTALTNFDPLGTAHYTSNAVWSTDGQSILSSGFRNGQNTLIAIRADGSGEEMLLSTTPGDPIYLVSGTLDPPFGALVQERPKPGALKFWPVPASGHLHVQLASPATAWQLRLIDAQGRTVLRLNATGPVLDADIGTLVPGVYEAIAYGQHGARVGMGRVVVTR